MSKDDILEAVESGVDKALSSKVVPRELFEQRMGHAEEAIASTAAAGKQTAIQLSEMANQVTEIVTIVKEHTKKLNDHSDENKTVAVAIQEQERRVNKFSNKMLFTIIGVLVSIICSGVGVLIALHH